MQTYIHNNLTYIHTHTYTYYIHLVLVNDFRSLGFVHSHKADVFQVYGFVLSHTRIGNPGVQECTNDVKTTCSELDSEMAGLVSLSPKCSNVARAFLNVLHMSGGGNLLPKFMPISSIRV